MGLSEGKADSSTTAVCEVDDNTSNERTYYGYCEVTLALY